MHCEAQKQRKNFAQRNNAKYNIGAHSTVIMICKLGAFIVFKSGKMLFSWNVYLILGEKCPINVYNIAINNLPPFIFSTL